MKFKQLITDKNNELHNKTANEQHVKILVSLLKEKSLLTTTSFTYLYLNKI